MLAVLQMHSVLLFQLTQCCSKVTSYPEYYKEWIWFYIASWRVCIGISETNQQSTFVSYEVWVIRQIVELLISSNNHARKRIHSWEKFVTLSLIWQVTHIPLWQRNEISQLNNFPHHLPGFCANKRPQGVTFLKLRQHTSLKKHKKTCKSMQHTGLVIYCSSNFHISSIT